MPSSAALRFISSTNSSTLPAVWQAITMAASFPDWSRRPYSSPRRVISSPALR